MDLKAVLSELTDEEKIALVSGRDFMYTNGIPRLGIRSVSMADGPHGLRKQIDEYDNGISASEPSVAFPTASATACSFNTENLFKLGAAMAEEAVHYGVNIVLGPATNVQKNPVCGRNFEYFSEDPYLAGKLSAAQIRGFKSRGVGVSLKHFALNNNENFRFMGDSIADMRAMREIYLKPFEIAVKESAPDTLMCAYNKINGTYCSQNKWLLTDVLRDEWGFDGAVMTDWGAMHDRRAALLAGLDIEMPGDTTVCRGQIYDSLHDSAVKAALDRSAGRVLDLADRFSSAEKCKADFDAHNELAARLAEDSAVLLKNDGSLPLSGNEKLCVIGELFEKMRYQGAGSSMINATRITSPKNAFDERGVEYTYFAGYRENTDLPDEDLMEEAISGLGDCDKVLFFIGLTDNAETEGCDRADMKLPANQLVLANKLLSTGKSIVAVLFGGSPVELPFADGVSAVLNMFLPGQNGGTAAANLLFGNVNPSGKLAQTWVREYSSVPFSSNYAKEEREVYKEGIFVGYRYQHSNPENVLYPFGYGLSYTSFAYSDLSVEADGECIVATLRVTNTGNRYGGEAVQLYTAKKDGSVSRPLMELRAFGKVYLEAGESKTLTLEFNKRDLSYYSIKENRWILEDGEYTLIAASSSVASEISEDIYVSGEVPPDEHYPTAEEVPHLTDADFEKYSGIKIPERTAALPLTMESRFSSFKLTFFGKIIYKAVMSMPNGMIKKAKRLPEGAERENMIKGAIFLRHMLESNTPQSMAMSAGKTISYNMAQALVHLANGRVFKAFGTLLKRIKAPRVPKQNS